MKRRFVFLGFRRGASSVLFMLVEGLLKRSGYNAEDIVARFHREAVSVQNIPAEALQAAFRNNLLVGCFREGVKTLERVTDFEVVPILVTRDPRDCQLSWFHARHLHKDDAVPVLIAEDAEIYQPLNVGDMFIENATELHDFARQRRGLVIKYEDVIQDPIAFLIDVAAFMNITPDREALDLMIMEANFLQLVSDTGVHNRLGRPYEALNSLSEENLQKLNESFGEVATSLGYPRAPDGLPSFDVRSLQARDVYKRFAIRLAQENGDRIDEIRRQRQLIEELQTENGYRIDEIRRINETLTRLRGALGDG